MSDFNKDSKDSIRIIHKAAPIIKDLFMQIPGLFKYNDLKIYQVEGQDNNICDLLDKDCGIDYFITSPKSNITISVAWRTGQFRKHEHYEPTVYNAFSLRVRRNNEKSNAKNCEISKRQLAIENNSVYPQYTVQCHYDPTNDDELLSIAVAKTDDVFEAYNRKFYRICNRNNKDKEVFMHDVQWEKMKEAGYKVYDWYGNDIYKGLYEPCVCDLGNAV